jgi:hypothetical protein
MVGVNILYMIVSFIAAIVLTKNKAFNTLEEDCTGMATRIFIFQFINSSCEELCYYACSSTHTLGSCAEETKEKNVYRDISQRGIILVLLRHRVSSD